MHTMEVDLGNWMADLELVCSSFSTRPLELILLPGTHDSGAYQCTPDVELSRFTGELALRWLLRCCPFLVKPWTLTQRLRITQQLDLGIRFLDLRLAVHQVRDESDVICLAHTLACEPLTEVLSQVHTWLSIHPGEVLIMRCTPDWPHRHTWDPHHTMLTWQNIKQCCPGDTYRRSHAPPTPAGLLLPTYGDVVKSGRRLIVLLELPVPVARRTPACAAGQLSDLIQVTSRSGSSAAAGPTPSQRTSSTKHFHHGAAPGDDWEELLACVWGPGLSAPFWAESDTAQGTLCGLLCQVREAQAHKADPRFRYAAFAVTPSVPAAVSRLVKQGKFGLEGLAEELAELLPELLAADLTGVCSITCDFPSPEFAVAIVAHNLAACAPCTS